MAEITPTPRKHKWHNLGTDLLKVTVAAFSDRIGDQPGDLSLESYEASLLKALPDAAHRRQQLIAGLQDQAFAQRFRALPWSNQNFIAAHLAQAGPMRVGHLAIRLAQLAGGETEHLNDAHVVINFYDTIHRADVIPALQTLSTLVVANSMDLPSRHPANS